MKTAGVSVSYNLHPPPTRKPVWEWHSEHWFPFVEITDPVTKLVFIAHLKRRRFFQMETTQ